MLTVVFWILSAVTFQRNMIPHGVQSATLSLRGRIGFVYVRWVYSSVAVRTLGRG
jgi:hypothetical protein